MASASSVQTRRHRKQSRARILVGVAAAQVLFAISATASECASTRRDDKFFESVTFDPIADEKHFLARFEFGVEAQLDDEFRSNNFDLFPKTVGKLLNARPDLRGFEAVLTRGRWKTEDWGPTDRDFRPPGALLVGAIDSNDPTEADTTWKFLTFVLSGALCASFEGMHKDASKAVSQGRKQAVPLADGSNKFLFATLPYEPVCTENLTPWLKLLPCNNHAGLASLLRPIPLAESTLVSLFLRVVRREDATVELKLSLDTVLVLPSASGIGFAAWLGPKNFENCPASDTSDVTLVVSGKEERERYPPNATISQTSKGDVLLKWRSSTFATIDNPGLQSGMKLPGLAKAKAVARPPAQSRESLVVMRDILTQEGKSERTHGRYLLRATNAGLGISREALFMEQLPFFIRPLWQTLRVTLSDPNGDLDTFFGIDAIRFLNLTFVPSDGKATPTEVYWSVVVPPGGTVNVFLDVLKSFLKVEQFSYACEKGFDVGSAAWLERDAAAPAKSAKKVGKTAFSASGAAQMPVGFADFVAAWDLDFSEADQTGWRLRFTEGLLVLVPMPDFSMPFNVLALTSTVITFFFGSMFRLTVAGHMPHWVLKKDVPPVSLKRKIVRFVTASIFLGVSFGLANAEDADLVSLAAMLPEDYVGDALQFLKDGKEMLSFLQMGGGGGHH